MKTNLISRQNRGNPPRAEHFAPIIELTDSELSSISGGQDDNVHFHHIVASGPAQQGQSSQLMLQTPYDPCDSGMDYPANYSGYRELYPSGGIEHWESPYYYGGQAHPLLMTNSDTTSTQSGNSSNPTQSSSSSPAHSSSGSSTQSSSGISTNSGNNVEYW